MKQLSRPPLYSDHAYGSYDDYGQDGPGSISKGDRQRSGTLQEASANRYDPYRKLIQAVVFDRLARCHRGGDKKRHGFQKTATSESPKPGMVSDKGSSRAALGYWPATGGRGSGTGGSAAPPMGDQTH